MSAKLDDYIRKSLDSGFSREEITAALRRVGWPQDEIDVSFDSLRENMQPMAPDYSPMPGENAQTAGLEEVDRYVANAKAEHKTNTLAIIALILSILGLAPVGLILSVIALSQIKKSRESGKALAIIAFILSVIYFLVYAVVIIGSIAFIGVLNPSNILPDKCTGAAGMDCLEKASPDISSMTISFSLKNNLGSAIQLTGFQALDAGLPACKPGVLISLNIEGADKAIPSESYPINAANGERMMFVVSCPGLVHGEKFAADYQIKYTNINSGLSQDAPVSIRGTA